MKPSVLEQQQVLVEPACIVSSPTPTTMSSEVPPNWKGTFTIWAIAIGSSAMGRQEERPRERDALHDLLDVLGRLRARLHARHEPALLLQILRQVDRIEDDRRVEVREDDDQDRREHEVQPRTRIEVRRDLAAALAAAELRERARDHDHRLREDDRHHARRVDAERDEVLGGLAHPAARHRALRDLHHDAAGGDRDRHHAGDHADHHHAEHHQRQRRHGTRADEAERVEDPGQNRSMIEKKISSEAPLPRPRSVICSPSHMTNIAPVTGTAPSSDERRSRARHRVGQRLREQREAVALHRGQRHGA
jgi:hypothetical protein